MQGFKLMSMLRPYDVFLFCLPPLSLGRETTVLTTLQVCVFPSSFKDRLLWLHIAISVSAALRLAFHLFCPSVAEVKPIESKGSQ